MTTVSSFVRRVPIDLLREHFSRIALAMPADFDWTGQHAPRRIMAVLEHYDGEPFERLRADVDRISAMADEIGDSALFSTTSDRQLLDAQPGPHARAYITFLRHPEEFRRAEEARFADEKRRGRNWEAYHAPANLPVSRDANSIDNFQRAVAKLIGSRQVEAEICERSRRRHQKSDAALVQVTVYIEGRMDNVAAFDDGHLAFVARRPVLEAAVIYEAESGVVEIVGQTAEVRRSLVALFAQHLLQASTVAERVPIRRYRIEHLRRPMAFPTMPEDGIESVAVRSMRLAPIGAGGEYWTIDVARGANRTIWDLAAQRLASSLDHFILVKVTLVVRFKSRQGRPRALPITISNRTGSNLKDCTEQERLVGEKYLREWKMLVDVDR